MNQAHKLSKQLKREQRKLRRVYHKDLHDKGQVWPAEATYHNTPKLPQGNLLLVATIKPISSDSSSVTRALRSIAETTLVVAQDQQGKEYLLEHKVVFKC